MYTGTDRPKTNILYSPEQVGRALTKAGINVYGEIDTHYIVYCPFHSNANTPAGEVDKASGQFWCFSCQATASLTKLIQRKGYSYFQAIRLIGDNDYDITLEIDRILNEQPEFVEFDGAVVARLHADVQGAGRDYFLGRGITDRSIARFELGYSEKQGMVTVPVHSPTGTLLGFVGRSIQGKRFKNSTGLTKSKTLFNLHRVWTSDRIYVVESSFDAIRLDQVSAPAAATLGAGISTEQIKLLNRTFDEVIVIPDNDQAGVAMTEKMSKGIPSLQILQLSDGKKDIGECSDDELRHLTT